MSSVTAPSPESSRTASPLLASGLIGANALLIAGSEAQQKTWLPKIGDGVSGREGPYGYLGKTIAEFPEPAELAGRIRDAGFAACGWEGLTGGIVAVHTAYKGQTTGGLAGFEAHAVSAS